MTLNRAYEKKVAAWRAAEKRGKNIEGRVGGIPSVRKSWEFGRRLAGITGRKKRGMVQKKFENEGPEKAAVESCVEKRVVALGWEYNRC